MAAATGPTPRKIDGPGISTTTKMSHMANEGGIYNQQQQSTVEIKDIMENEKFIQHMNRRLKNMTEKMNRILMKQIVSGSCSSSSNSSRGSRRNSGADEIDTVSAAVNYGSDSSIVEEKGPTTKMQVDSVDKTNLTSTTTSTAVVVSEQKNVDCTRFEIRKSCSADIENYCNSIDETESETPMSPHRPRIEPCNNLTTTTEPVYRISSSTDYDKPAQLLRGCGTHNDVVVMRIMTEDGTRTEESPTVLFSTHYSNTINGRTIEQKKNVMAECMSPSTSQNDICESTGRFTAVQHCYSDTIGEIQTENVDSAQVSLITDLSSTHQSSGDTDHDRGSTQNKSPGGKCENIPHESKDSLEDLDDMLSSTHCEEVTCIKDACEIILDKYPDVLSEHDHRITIVVHEVYNMLPRLKKSIATDKQILGYLWSYMSYKKIRNDPEMWTRVTDVWANDIKRFMETDDAAPSITSLNNHRILQRFYPKQSLLPTLELPVRHRTHPKYKRKTKRKKLKKANIPPVHCSSSGGNFQGNAVFMKYGTTIVACGWILKSSAAHCAMDSYETNVFYTLQFVEKLSDIVGVILPYVVTGGSDWAELKPGDIMYWDRFSLVRITDDPLLIKMATICPFMEQKMEEIKNIEMDAALKMNRSDESSPLIIVDESSTTAANTRIKNTNIENHRSSNQTHNEIILNTAHDADVVYVQRNKFEEHNTATIPVRSMIWMGEQDNNILLEKNTVSQSQNNHELFYSVNIIPSSPTNTGDISVRKNVQPPARNNEDQVTHVESDNNTPNQPNKNIEIIKKKRNTFVPALETSSSVEKSTESPRQENILEGKSAVVVQDDPDVEIIMGNISDAFLINKQMIVEKEEVQIPCSTETLHDNYILKKIKLYKPAFHMSVSLQRVKLNTVREISINKENTVSQRSSVCHSRSKYGRQRYKPSRFD